MDATAAGLPAALAAKFLRKKFLIRIGGDLLWERAAESGVFVGSMDDFYKSKKYLSFKPLIFKVIKFVLKRADKIIVTAENLKPIYADYYGIDENKIEVIPNAFVKYEADESVKDRKEKVILFAGRLVKYKNIDKLIEVVNVILNEMKNPCLRQAGRDSSSSQGGTQNDRRYSIKLLIVGEGPEEKDLKFKVKSLKPQPPLGSESRPPMSIGASGLEDKIEFRKGVSKEELLEIIKSIDLGISIAWTEYNPNFILECISLGKPVLLNRNNGLTISLPEDYLCDPFNKEEIKGKIINLLNNYEKAEKFLTGLEIKNTWSDVISKLEALLNKE
jgi:glycosyltransferase involved in cell wall biosynthesis